MTDTKETADTATCGCCAAAAEEKTHSNRPGLPALEYRTGTHGSFLRRMIKKLPLQEVADEAGQPVSPLKALTTQETSDPAIALLDAWAVVADVLTFYQERIANECYLRTATERRSVLELAREISYELNPGVAASTHLAFTVADTEGSPESVTVPQGMRVMSIPAPGKLPQTFETGAELVARPEWNALKPKTTKPHALVSNSVDAYLQGIGLGLKSGDYLLFVGEERLGDPTNENWDIRQITEIKEYPDDSYTYVSWQEGLGGEKDGHWVKPAKNPRIYAFRQRASLFGYNAPDWHMMSFDLKTGYMEYKEEAVVKAQTEWPGFTLYDLCPGGTDIYLDTLYPKVFTDTWCSLTVPEYGGILNYRELYRITAVAEDSQTAFGLSAKTSRLTISGENLNFFNDQIRQTVVVCASEELTAAGEPDKTSLSPSDDSVTLDGAVSGLLAGKVLIISGTSSDDGTVVSEGVTLMKEAVIDTTASTTISGESFTSLKVFDKTILQDEFSFVTNPSTTRTDG